MPHNLMLNNNFNKIYVTMNTRFVHVMDEITKFTYTHVS